MQVAGLTIQLEHKVVIQHVGAERLRIESGRRPIFEKQAQCAQTWIGIVLQRL